MRAKDLIFHVNCFSCLVCGQLLRGGDTAGIRDGRVFCGDHYESEVLSEPETISPQFFPVTTAGGMAVQSSQKGRPRKRKLATPQPPGLLDPTGGPQHPTTCPSLQSTPTQPQAPQLQTQQTTPPQPLEALDAGTPLRLGKPWDPEPRLTRAGTASRSMCMLTFFAPFFLSLWYELTDSQALINETFVHIPRRSDFVTNYRATACSAHRT
uniref:LIM zinc-binding domain-containing protein n=1 Tax=Anopheles maculatus TaxID=74869 RepID=A0A182SK00_9DIPT